MIVRTRPSTQQGITLIEILIAVLIFSLGLIGVAGLLVMATGANHGGYLRTQVTYLAQNMADRMSANPIGVWSGAYDSDEYPLAVSKSCSGVPGCTPEDLAVHDQEMWSSQLETFLPNGKATIECTEARAGFMPQGAQLGMRPPYGGTCHMTISWTDRGSGAESDRESEEQTFAWEFQP